MYGEDAASYVEKILAKMKPLGIVRIEAHYSGGNDEGGVDDMQALGENDQEIELDEELWIETGETYPNGEPVRTYNEDTIQALLDDVLSTQYGSWAGDFSAFGVLYVDAGERRAWTEGQEEVWQEESHPIDVTL